MLQLLSCKLLELRNVSEKLDQVVFVLTICFANNLLVHLLRNCGELTLRYALRSCSSLNYLTIVL